MLRQTRRAGGLTQRELAGRAGVPQATIARIESGRLTPRVDTLDRLLRACGYNLEPVPSLGLGVDRTLLRDALLLTPSQRAAQAVHQARVFSELQARAIIRRP